MFNDVIKEQLVARRSGKAEILKAVGLGVGALLLIYLTLYLTFFVIPGDFSLMFLVLMLGGICWGTSYLFKTIPMEFEYLAVNGDLTVDKIVAKSRRKRIHVIDLRNIEAAGIFTPQTREKVSHTVFKNCSSTDPANGLYLVFNSMGNSKVLMVISPDEKMAAALKPFISSRLVFDGFPSGRWDESLFKAEAADPAGATESKTSFIDSAMDKAGQLFQSIKGKIIKK
ncbi:MAG: hypothetical protein FWE86_00940 [Oscillospiraceae bacterium]|nr:hypothetical protein [Oscillospiraceae bacterium]